MNLVRIDKLEYGAEVTGRVTGTFGGVFTATLISFNMSGIPTAVLMWEGREMPIQWQDTGGYWFHHALGAFLHVKLTDSTGAGIVGHYPAPPAVPTVSRVVDTSARPSGDSDAGLALAQLVLASARQPRRKKWLGIF